MSNKRKRNKQTKKRKPETVYEKMYNNPHLEESLMNSYGIGLGENVSNLSMYKGNKWYQHYFDWLMEIALQLFEWENLPREIPFYEIESNLIHDGVCALYFDKTFSKYVALRGVTEDINYYNEPIRFQPANVKYNNKPFNLYVEARELEDCGVLIRNNLHMRGLTHILSNYASELAEIRQVIEMNLNVHKNPIAVAVDDYNLLSMQKAFDKISQNSPVIFGKKNSLTGATDLDDIKALNLNVPYIIDKLQTYHKQVFDEALNRIGLNSVNDQKKERMIVDEANANEDKYIATQNNLLMFREQGATRTNEYFGLNISVKPRIFSVKTEYGDIYSNDGDFRNNFGGVTKDEF